MQLNCMIQKPTHYNFYFQSARTHAHTHTVMLTLFNYGVSDSKEREKKNEQYATKLNAKYMKRQKSCHLSCKMNIYNKIVPKCNWTVESRATAVVVYCCCCCRCHRRRSHHYRYNDIIVSLCAYAFWCRLNVFLCVAAAAAAFHKKHDMCDDHLQFCKSACNAVAAAVVVVAANFDS